ncbi:hypothetical protein PTR77_24950 [Serratia bockelmannii]|uniref:hypothetical protein n=1 Tax=Serratia bockelmannii TaxID=2703793 RepID=UPI00313AF048
MGLLLMNRWRQFKTLGKRHLIATASLAPAAGNQAKMNVMRFTLCAFGRSVTRRAILSFSGAFLKK